MKLTIINQPVCNRGDQAAHRALIRLLTERCKNAEIDVLILDKESRVATFAEARNNVKYLSFPSIRKHKKAMRRALHLPNIGLKVLPLFSDIRRYNKLITQSDYVLCAPGGINMGGYLDWKHTWNLANAQALGKRTGIFGRSIGPFSEETMAQRVFKRRAIEILLRVDHLSLRDKHSQEVAQELGLSYTPSIDTAFAYRPDAELALQPGFTGGQKYAVFVPNQLSHKYHRSKFKQASLDVLYRSIMETILAKGYDVAMLPQLFGTEKVDRPYFEFLAQGSDRVRVHVLSDTLDCDVQQKVISGASFVVGARYHSIIFAINNHVPFLCLSYEHKMDGALEDLGLSEYLLPLGELLDHDNGIATLAASLHSIIKNHDTIVSQLELARKKAEAIVKEAFSDLLHRINEHT